MSYTSKHYANLLSYYFASYIYYSIMLTLYLEYISENYTLLPTFSFHPV